MSIIMVETGTAIPNFLDSAVGLVAKTCQIPATMGVADGKYKTVFAGTPFPANDATAIGIVFQDVDVTDGDAVGTLMVAGRVITECVTVSQNAKSALIGKGIVFVNAEEVTRGFSVTYDEDDGTGTVPVDTNVYAPGDVAVVDATYPLTKTGSAQTGWALTSGGDAVDAPIQMEADVVLYPVWTAD